MRALITGVAGFIGSNLAESLIATPGVSVVGVDSFTDYYGADLKQRNLDAIGGGAFEFRRADVRSLSVEEIQEFDAIFHLAAQPGVRASWGRTFADYVSANIEATQWLLEASKGSSRLQRFVYSSSSSVYGDAERFPTVETDMPRPFSPYGVTKLAAEHMCGLYARNFGVPTVSLRYFTVYGPRQRPDMAFTRFVRAAVEGTPIHIYGDGHQTRDFTFVDDIVRANVTAARAEVRPGSVYNVAGGSNVSVREVLALIEEMSQKDLLVEYQPSVAGDVRVTRGSTSLIESDLGWKAEVDLREGLERHYGWAVDQWGVDVTPATSL
ncbi:UDP-glucose 4-epimerase [Aeromicrobium sp. Root495]|uniref:NAD-dependent epimerase/dehydratase family protein n=1 Tax=Aeromicrobium sp. Root495 TaxID=1736550 RepID=UPI0006FF2F34|nr:NAD-dependent epimerase/dehydratase family protein [Aeromicrobium sp. Root495]KQY55358.1 UDP-glucose 4-epimerase [Aeromicrobium sp. Root495]